MAFYQDIDVEGSGRRLRLETLIRLRWLAVAGQSISILVVAFWLKFPLPLLPAAVLIALLAAVNFFLAVRFAPAHRLTPASAFASSDTSIGSTRTPCRSSRSRVRRKAAG